MQCFVCNIVLDDEMQHYGVSDIGSEINSIISRTLNIEIDYNSNLCGECFNTAVNQLSVESRTVPTGQCVCCQQSIINRHSHSLLDCPERDDIALRILPLQIHPGNRVCYACWLAARRNVQQAQHQEYNRISSSPQVTEDTSSMVPPSISLPQSSTSQPQSLTSQSQPSTSYEPFCAWCQRSIARQHTHSLPDGPERDFIARRISPRLITTHSKVCYACWLSARRNTQRDVTVATTNNDEPLTTLPNYKRTGNSSSSCFVHGCTNSERLIVPNILKYRLLKMQKLFVTENARICSHHLRVYDWEFIDDQVYINQFSSAQLEAATTYK